MTIDPTKILDYINAHPTNTPGYCLAYWDAAARAAGNLGNLDAGKLRTANAARALTPGISRTVPASGFVWFDDPEGDVGFIHDGVAYFTDATENGRVGKLSVAQRLSNLQRIHGTANASLAGYSTNYLGVAFAEPVAVHSVAPGSSSELLKSGSTGAAVKALQSGLNRVFPAYSKLTVDGIYGAKTTAVVKEFQQRAGLTVDGIVGPQTTAALAKYGVTL